MALRPASAPPTPGRLGHGSRKSVPQPTALTRGPGIFRRFSQNSKFRALDPLGFGSQVPENYAFGSPNKESSNYLGRWKWECLDTFQTPTSHSNRRDTSPKDTSPKDASSKDTIPMRNCCNFQESMLQDLEADLFEEFQLGLHTLASYVNANMNTQFQALRHDIMTSLEGLPCMADSVGTDVNVMDIANEIKVTFPAVLASFEEMMQEHRTHLEQFLQTHVIDHAATKQSSNEENFSQIRSAIRSLGTQIQDNQADVSKGFSELSTTVQQHRLELDTSELMKAIKAQHSEMTEGFENVLAQTLSTQLKKDLAEVNKQLSALDLRMVWAFLKGQSQEMLDRFADLNKIPDTALLLKELQAQHSDAFSKVLAAMEQIRVDIDRAPVLTAIQNRAGEVTDSIKDTRADIEELSKSFQQKLTELDVASVRSMLKDHSNEMMRSFSNVDEAIKKSSMEIKTAQENEAPIDFSLVLNVLQDHQSHVSKGFSELYSTMQQHKVELDIAPLLPLLKDLQAQHSDRFSKVDAILQQLQLDKNYTLDKDYIEKQMQHVRADIDIKFAELGKSIQQRLARVDVASVCDMLQDQHKEMVQSFSKVDEVVKQSNNEKELSRLRTFMQALGSQIQEDLAQVNKQIHTLDVGMVCDAVKSQSRELVDELSAAMQQQKLELDTTPLFRELQAQHSDGFSKVRRELSDNFTELKMLQKNAENIDFTPVLSILRDQQSDLSKEFSELSAEMQQHKLMMKQLQVDTDRAPILTAIQTRGNEVNDRVDNIGERFQSALQARDSQMKEHLTQINQLIKAVDVGMVCDAVKSQRRELVDHFTELKLLQKNAPPVDLSPVLSVLQDQQSDMSKAFSELSATMQQQRLEYATAQILRELQAQHSDGFSKVYSMMQQLQGKHRAKSVPELFEEAPHINRTTQEAPSKASAPDLKIVFADVEGRKQTVHARKEPLGLHFVQNQMPIVISGFNDDSCHGREIGIKVGWTLLAFGDADFTHYPNTEESFRDARSVMNRLLKDLPR